MDIQHFVQIDQSFSLFHLLFFYVIINTKNYLIDDLDHINIINELKYKSIYILIYYILLY